MGMFEMCSSKGKTRVYAEDMYYFYGIRLRKLIVVGVKGINTSRNIRRQLRTDNRFTF